MPAPFTVTSVRKRPEIDATGKFREVYEVIFVTGKGNISNIKIPVEVYTVEFARRQVAEEAAKLDALMA